MRLTDKPWWQSKTIWGGAVAVGAGLAGLFGVDIDASTQDGIVQNILSVASGVGGLIAIYGRLKAEQSVRRLN